VALEEGCCGRLVRENPHNHYDDLFRIISVWSLFVSWGFEFYGLFFFSISV
jgi:hypothetical protein